MIKFRACTICKGCDVDRLKKFIESNYHIELVGMYSDDVDLDAFSRIVCMERIKGVSPIMFELSTKRKLDDFFTYITNHPIQSYVRLNLECTHDDPITLNIEEAISVNRDKICSFQIWRLQLTRKRVEDLYRKFNKSVLKDFYVINDSLEIEELPLDILKIDELETFQYTSLYGFEPASSMELITEVIPKLQNLKLLHISCEFEMMSPVIPFKLIAESLFRTPSIQHVFLFDHVLSFKIKDFIEWNHSLGVYAILNWLHDSAYKKMLLSIDYVRVIARMIIGRI